MTNDTAENRILAAAFNVVDRNTISGTRMHLIAEEAGMVQSNLHYYFKTKKDLLMALLRYIQKDFMEKRVEDLTRRADCLSDQLAGFFEQKKEIIRDNRKYDRAQFDYWSLGQIDPEINACFRDSYNIWRGHIVDTVRRYQPNANEQRLTLLAGIMVSMMMGASLQYLNARDSFDLDAYFSICEGMIERYLESEP